MGRGLGGWCRFGVTGLGFGVVRQRGRRTVLSRLAAVRLRLVLVVVDLSDDLWFGLVLKVLGLLVLGLGFGGSLWMKRRRDWWRVWGWASVGGCADLCGLRRRVCLLRSA